MPLNLSNTRGTNLRDIKERLELLDQQPLVITNVRPVEFLQGVDARAANQRVQRVFFFQVATVGRLVRTHLDLDGHGGLALFANLDLLVVALDAGSVGMGY